MVLARVSAFSVVVFVFRGFCKKVTANGRCDRSSGGRQRQWVGWGWGWWCRITFSIILFLFDSFLCFHCSSILFSFFVLFCSEESVGESGGTIERVEREIEGGRTCVSDILFIRGLLGFVVVGGHFSAVARGRKLCVLILVCLVSAFVGLCWVDQLCGRRLLFMVLCRRRGDLS